MFLSHFFSFLFTVFPVLELNINSPYIPKNFILYQFQITMTNADVPYLLLLKLAELENNHNALAHTVAWVTKELEEGIQRYVPLPSL